MCRPGRKSGVNKSRFYKYANTIKQKRALSTSERWRVQSSAEMLQHPPQSMLSYTVEETETDKEMSVGIQTFCCCCEINRQDVSVLLTMTQLGRSMSLRRWQELVVTELAPAHHSREKSQGSLTTHRLTVLLWLRSSLQWTDTETERSEFSGENPLFKDEISWFLNWLGKQGVMN